MTEVEWLSATDPTPMLELLRGKASDRKLRLFACACCRRCRQMLVSETLDGLTVAERFADGLASSVERRVAREAAFHAGWCPDPSTAHRRGPAKSCVTDALARSAYEAATQAERRARTARAGGVDEQPAGIHASLVRDIFPSTFRPVVPDTVWFTPTVVAISTSIYADRAFDRLPILADALEEAGCVNADLLLHCRQPGEHVRGCWAVDMVLGKA